MTEPHVAAPNRTIGDPAAGRAQRIAQLISLGRDREAAELAEPPAGTSSPAPPHQGDPMDVPSQLQELGPLLAGAVGGLTPDDLDRPTPCTDFTVRGVLEHMIGGATQFAAAFRGDPAPAPPDEIDVLTAFGPALDDLAGSILGPGALEGEVDAPFGTVPAETFARFVVLDGLTHGWDLSTATGQRYEPSDSLVAEVRAFAEQAVPPLRDGGATFGDAVVAHPGATPIEELAAFTGRAV